MLDSNEDPLFSLDDYVPPGGGLPAHLEGKSAQEVAAYYSGQLKVVDEKARDKIAAAPPPAAATQPPADPPLRQSDVAPALGTMIASAKMVAKANFDAEGQKLWDRFIPDIENVMKAGFRGTQLADAQNWIFAYNQVLGAKASILMKEARDGEINRRSAESVTPPAGSIKPEEITLEPAQMVVAEGLGIGDAGYKQGIINLRGDKWPMTFDNRR